MSRTRFFTGVALLILLDACGGEADVQVGVGVGVVSGSVSGNQFAAGVFDSGTDPLRIDGGFIASE